VFVGAHVVDAQEVVGMAVDGVRSALRVHPSVA
jgi:hypothetical protein